MRHARRVGLVALALAVAVGPRLASGRGGDAFAGDPTPPTIEVAVFGPERGELDDVVVLVGGLPLRRVGRVKFRADLSELGPGRATAPWLLRVQHPAFVEWVDTLSLPYRPDGTLVPGLRVFVVTPLERRPEPRVRGTVVDADGRPVAGAAVADAHDATRFVTTDASGRYALPTGRRSVRVCATTPDRGTARADVTPVGADGHDLAPLVLDPGAELAGTIADDAAAAWGAVVATPVVPGAAEDHGGPVAFVPAVPPGVRARLWTAAGTPGPFRLRGASPGRWRVAYVGPRRFAVPVHPELADAFEAIVAVPGPAVALGAPAAWLTVVVAGDGTPWAGATVAFAAPRGRLVVRADADGRASAWVRADRPQAITVTAPAAEPRAIRWTPGAPTTLDVVLAAAADPGDDAEIPDAPTDAPALVVVAEDGRPVAADVRVVDATGTRASARFVEVLTERAWVEWHGGTSPRGAVRLAAPLPPGTYRVEVSGPDLEPRTVDADFRTSPLELRVRHRGRPPR